MISVSSRVLSLSAEAALLVRGGRIVYANARAEQLLGPDCVGKALREIFSAEIAEAQARVFTADTTVSGRSVNVRTAKLDDMQAFFLSETGYALTPVSDAFLYSMRSALMNLRLSQDLCRTRAEKLGDGELGDELRTMQRSVFAISRLLENASVVRAAASGELTADLAALDLAALCRAIVESVSLLRQDIRFRLYAEGELCLLGDRVLIEQMIFNLISNCLVHAEGLTQVTLRLTPTPTQLILSVSDDGCGRRRWAAFSNATATGTRSAKWGSARGWGCRSCARSPGSTAGRCCSKAARAAAPRRAFRWRGGCPRRRSAAPGASSPPT